MDVDEKHHRRALGDADFAAPLCSARVGPAAWIDDQSEGRPAALLVGLVPGFVGALVEVGRGVRREVATGRKAEDADLVGIAAPFLRLAAHDAEGALDILHAAAPHGDCPDGAARGT
jgi:hypothetical protein